MAVVESGWHEMLGRKKHRTPLERLKVYAQACGEAGRDPVLAVGGIDPFGDEHPSPHCLTCVCRAPVRRPSAKTVRSRSSTSGLWCP